MAPTMGRCAAMAAVGLAAMLLALAPSGTEAKGYYNAGYGRTYYYGPTRYYFFYNGQRHYYGTRTWGTCNGHCDQDVYIDEAAFEIHYLNAPTSDQAKAGLRALWPSLDPSMISTTTGSRPSSILFRVLLPDGTYTSSFTNAVKEDVERACGAGGVASRLAPDGNLDCTFTTVSVAIRQISTQAESGGAALTLPSMVCVVLAAVSVLLS